jgi:excisionase family DNA binding protein
MCGTHEPLPDVLRVEEVAQYLRIGRDQAYALMHQPGFPRLRLGRQFRVPRDAFLRWVAGAATADDLGG